MHDLNAGVLEQPSRRSSIISNTLVEEFHQPSNIKPSIITNTTANSIIAKPSGSLVKNVRKALNLDKVEYQGYRVN